MLTANDFPSVARALQRGLVIVLLLSVVTALLMAPARGLLLATHQQAEIIEDTTSYVRISIPGVVPYR